MEALHFLMNITVTTEWHSCQLTPHSGERFQGWNPTLQYRYYLYVCYPYVIKNNNYYKIQNTKLSINVIYSVLYL